MAKVIGITGCIASGKSLALKFVQESGIEVLSIDKFIHHEYLPKGKFYNKIIDIFGRDVLNYRDEIDRKIMLDKILQDEKLLLKLNNAIHPEIACVVKNVIDECRRENKIFAMELPLLFELNLDKYFDVILVIASDYANILARIENKKYCNKKVLDFFSKYQLLQELKIERSDYVIYNNSTENDLKLEIQKFLDKVIKCST